MASIFLRAGWSTIPQIDHPLSRSEYQYFIGLVLQPALRKIDIHCERVGDQFVGWSVTGISSLSKDFGMSPVHFDWKGYPSNLKDKMETLIEENFVRRTYVSGTTFELLKYLFACICFHYEHLDAHLHPNHRLRASPIYIASGREKYLHKHNVIRYPWLITSYTPYATGIPQHVMLMAKIEALKVGFEKQTTHIFEETRLEINAQNVRGDLYKAGGVLDKIKAANE